MLSTGYVGGGHILLFAKISRYSEHVYIHGMVIMHVFNSLFSLINNFDNSLYNNPLTVNRIYFYIVQSC